MNKKQKLKREEMESNQRKEERQNKIPENKKNEQKEENWLFFGEQKDSEKVDC